MVCEMPAKAPHEHAAASFHDSELRVRSRLQVQAPGLITSETVEEQFNFLTLYSLYGMGTITEVHQNVVMNTKYVNWPGSVSVIISSGDIALCVQTIIIRIV